MEQAHAEWQQKNRRNLSVGKKNVVDFFRLEYTYCKRKDGEILSPVPLHLSFQDQKNRFDLSFMELILQTFISTKV